MLNSSIPIVSAPTDDTTEHCPNHKGDHCGVGANPLKYESFKVACSSCNLRELCLPVGLSQPQLTHLDSLVATRKTVKRGDALFHTGDPFRSVYAVRTGFFKTRISAEDGRDQVTGFQMAGELIGLDGILSLIHI